MKKTMCALAFSFVGLWSHSAVANWCIEQGGYLIEFYNGSTVTAKVECLDEREADLASGKRRECCNRVWVSADGLDDRGGYFNAQCDRTTEKTRVALYGNKTRTWINVSCARL